MPGDLEAPRRPTGLCFSPVVFRVHGQGEAVRRGQQGERDRKVPQHECANTVPHCISVSRTVQQAADPGDNRAASSDDVGGVDDVWHRRDTGRED